MIETVLDFSDYYRDSFLPLGVLFIVLFMLFDTC